MDSAVEAGVDQEAEADVAGSVVVAAAVDQAAVAVVVGSAAAEDADASSFLWPPRILSISASTPNLHRSAANC